MRRLFRARCVLSGPVSVFRTSVASGPRLSVRAFGGGGHSSVAPGSVVPFPLADIGEGIAAVEIIKWYKKEGDDVQEFDKLCEVQSDKATVDITSPFDGKIVKVYYGVGETAKTGLPLVDIKVAGGETSSAAPAAAAPVAAAPKSSASSSPVSAPSASAPAAASASVTAGTGKVLTTPTVRRLAREHNLDLRTVPATGREGRVLKGDVLAFLSNQNAATSSASAKPAASAPSVAASPAAAAAVPSVASLLRDYREPIKGIKKAMVKSMTASAAIPWFGYSDEIEVDRLMLARQQLKPLFEKRGLKLTYMPLILKAVAISLRDFPVLNSSVSADASELIYHGSINLGVAMDTPQGLVVPNIKDVTNLSVTDIAVELQKLQEIAQAGKLGVEHLSGGTFTISNIGNIGGTYLSPVPMPGEVAIGAIGKIHKVARFDADNQVVPRHIMEVSWRADHRVIDGATIARFSEQFRSMVENPLLMLPHLK